MSNGVGVRAYGLGPRAYGLELMVQGKWFRVQGTKCRSSRGSFLVVWGLGFRVKASGARGQGAGFRASA
jgi:hypothetical protein